MPKKPIKASRVGFISVADLSLWNCPEIREKREAKVVDLAPARVGPPDSLWLIMG